MNADATGPATGSVRRLEAARGGDEQAFGELVEPYRARAPRPLLPDARLAVRRRRRAPGDAASAWRGLARFEAGRPLRPWLYRIATNVCLDAIAKRPKRVLPVDYGPPAGAGEGPGEPVVELVWLEPYPDETLGLESGLAVARGALRAARERRARLRRRAAAPTGEPARGADPARGAGLLGPRGRRVAADDGGLCQQLDAASA